jgi:Methionine biosynthesis protein MetW
MRSIWGLRLVSGPARNRKAPLPLSSKRRTLNRPHLHPMRAQRASDADVMLDSKPVRTIERIGGDRWSVIRNLVGNETESLLDIGCRDRALVGHLPVSTHYVGLDLYPPADVIANADGPLPFEDDSFETVVLADVLEHLDDPHSALDEAMRVGRSAVVVLLPNIYTLYYRLQFLSGRLPGSKYAFGPERPGDRHRWLPSFEEAAWFTRRRAEAAGWQVVREHAYDKPYRRRAARLAYWVARVVGTPSLWSWEYVARLQPGSVARAPGAESKP